MSFRRIPFQFSTTNPADRQSELMRRFGVPSEDRMFTEPPSNSFMDALSHSSPRLQHRLPGFLGNDVQQSEESQGCAENVDLPKTEPKVRIVPIRIEGQSENQDRRRTSSESTSIPIVPPNNPAGEEHSRQRVNSGSSIPTFDSHKINSAFFPNSSFFSHQKPEEHSSAGISEPETKVCNIPINLEGNKNNKGRKLSHSKTVPLQKEASKRSASNMGNGPCMSKSANEPPVDEMKEDKRQKTDISASLKQIETILKEFKSYEEGVGEFSDVQNVKRYRYLDEMLTRCMLKLDDIETFGNEEVRKARKAAVKRVQDAINVLDSKVQSKPEESGQVEDKGKELAKGDDLNPAEATIAEDVVMAECTAESQTSMNGNISESKPNLDEVPDTATMEVEVSEKSTSENADCEVKNNIESENAISSENNTMLVAINGAEEAPKSSESTDMGTVKEDEETLPVDVSTAVTCTDLDSLKDSCKHRASETPVMDSKSEASSKDCTVIANGQLVPYTDENSQNSKLEDNTRTEDENSCLACVKVPIASDSLHPAVNDVDMKDVEHENEVAAQS